MDGSGGTGAHSVHLSVIYRRRPSLADRNRGVVRFQRRRWTLHDPVARLQTVGPVQAFVGDGEQSPEAVA